MKESAELVVGNASELLTCADDAPDLIGVIRGGWVAVRGGRVLAVGAKSDVEPLISSATEFIDAAGGIVAPGFVDSHTHVVFGGTRVGEYFAKIEKLSPEETERRGIRTGILTTLEPTRKHSLEFLYEETAARVKDMIVSGSTTIESKSGYGLDRETEIKQLEVNGLLEARLPVSIASTFLGGHGWPHDMSKEKYMDFLIKDMIPFVGSLGLAEFCDAWCDEGHYTAKECGAILEAGAAAGMRPKLHEGGYSYIGGAEVASDLHAVSADHLNYVPRKSLRKLAESGVTGVPLPGIDFAVGHPLPFDPAPMIDEGLEIAIATNCCPGCWCTSMPFIMILACRNHGMSSERAIRAATIAGAKALGRQDRVGSIEPGKNADIQVWNLGHHEDIAYHYKGNPVAIVIKDGKVAARDSRLVSGERRQRGSVNKG
ncbi:MAG: imidazolonepropionase [Synergistaceae bacterium]|jgi:imidazolonepropionase|nr:imidazolonepropionase [Synergistaceae bacterium]